ncbi:MAG: HD-GYP domain-containing protein [Nitrospiraceae bacterium]|nr:MAG: HD-GYP domain-containing protein [Nitrospiraceae bacterium]
MIKKVKSSQLRPGMYIHDLNCGWLEHPFWGSSLKVRDAATVNKIVNLGIREVFIDTEKGIDVAGVPERDRPAEHEHHFDNTDENVQAATVPETEEYDLGFKEIRRVPLHQEIFRARKIKDQAMLTVRNVMNEIRGGGNVEKEQVEDTVNDIIVSVMRNPDALGSLGRLRKSDEYLYAHSLNVCVLMVSFGKYLGFEPMLLRDSGIGALLHDIGTMHVPEHILNKRSALSGEEYDLVREHVESTRRVMESSRGIPVTAVLTAYQHHERIDGSGYPQGLKGNEISHAAQAMAIVDVYDALSTKRSFRRRMPPTQALQMLYEWSGTKFDRELVQNFIRCIGIYPAGSVVRLESGLIGIIVRHNVEKLLEPVVRIVFNAKTHMPVTIPYDIDLAADTGRGAGDRIAGFELAEEWDIRPERYL